MSDPFTSAASTATAPAPGAAGADPFGQPPTSSYPKMEDLDKRLLLIKPSLIEKVMQTFEGQDPKEVERITADVSVLDGGELLGEDVPATFDAMFISQAALVGSLKPALRSGGMILGRLRKFPTKGNKDKYPTPEDVERALAAYFASGGKSEKVNFSWKLQEFTPEDAQKARAFLQK